MTGSEVLVPGPSATNTPFRRASWLAWLFVGTVLAVTTWGVLDDVPGEASRTSDLLWAIIPVTYGVVGAFIVHRQPRNAIGWLLVVPGAAAVLDPPAQRLLAEVTPVGGRPVEATAPLLLALWVDNYAWLLVLFPVILMLALFPTGRPVTPAWRWHTRTMLGMAGLLLVAGSLQERVGPLDEPGWTVDNPIGVLAAADVWPWFMPLWNAGLITIVFGALASMVVRYRRAGQVERKQIIWLLYAVTLFALVYVPLAFLHESLAGTVVDAALVVALLFIPIAMAIAILRYRLFDIDVVVRRTVTFAVVTVLLALTYLASVLVFSFLAGVVTGIDSAVGVAASTLLVVGLFNPLRRRTHRAVERRLFRAPYDRSRIVTAFSRQMGQETDITLVTGNLLDAVTTTLHPSTSAVWVRGRPDADGSSSERPPVRSAAASRPA